MDETHVVEVVLRVALIRLLVYQIIFAYLICFLILSTGWMGLKFDADSIFFVDPEGFDAFVNGVSLNEAPGL